jgi:class 3 adenylate cyclase
MSDLSDKQRALLPKRAFAYIDSRGRRRLPIYDEAHIRSALGRFNQVQFESEAARDEARAKILKAARRFGVLPVGFIQSQLRTERRLGQADRLARRAEKWPTGAVTFLMTDIEGSTSLLAELEDRYAKLLADVRRVLRAQVRRAGGHEVEIHADELLAAFARPHSAVEAALGIQRRMRDKQWPDERRVLTRIGVHRGHPTRTETGYIGLSVHAVARVCQAAHGGQIIISRSVHEAIVEGLTEEIGFRDLGHHKLRGFPRPDVLYQVEAVDLPTEFPPLRTSF